jgi:general secretion pathway protein E
MVRRVCPHCAVPTQAPEEAEVAYTKEIGESRTQFLYGKGCNACANTGYLGRVAVFEVMVMNQQMRAALLAGAGADELRGIAKKAGMITMWRDGMLKVKDSITTPSEVLRNVFQVG